MKTAIFGLAALLSLGAIANAEEANPPANNTEKTKAFALDFSVEGELFAFDK